MHQHRAIKEEEEKKKQEEKRKKVEAWKEKRKMPFENTVEESPSKCSRTLTNNDAVVGNGSVESGMTGGNDLSSPSVHPHVTVKQERRPEAESQDRVAATQSMSNHSGAEIKKELNGDESESSKGKSSEVSNSGENTEAECSRPNDRARPQTLKPNAGSSENVSEKLELIDVDEIHAYLARIYEFDNISALEEKRPIFSDDGPIEEPEKPTELPSQLKSLPYLVKGKGRKTTKEMVISPGGKTPVMLLNEYCQRLMSTKPEYKESHRQNPQSPFGIEVIINGMKYGDGEGNTKKLAKQMAAEKTLSILVPDKFKQVQDYTFSGKELEVSRTSFA